MLSKIVNCMAHLTTELSLAERLGRLHRLWRTVADAELIPLGLTHPRWTALWKISQLGDGVSQKVLADALEIELASLMRTLSQLEQQQFIIRRSCTNDKRARVVSLTDAGVEILKQMETHIVRVRGELLASVNEQELTEFSRVLAVITDNALTKLANNTVRCNEKR